MVASDPYLRVAATPAREHDVAYPPSSIPDKRSEC